MLPSYTFDKTVSAMAKSLAMVLMFMHHLWTNQALGPYFMAGHYGKLCVGIFMFISGFGLMASCSGGGKIPYIQKIKKNIVAILVCHADNVTRYFALA